MTEYACERTTQAKGTFVQASLLYVCKMLKMRVFKVVASQDNLLIQLRLGYTNEYIMAYAPIFFWYQPFPTR